MEMGTIPLLAMLKERMAWLSHRQDTLAQNVTNVDTPGYVAKDIKAIDFEKLLRGASGPDSAARSLALTNTAHLQGTMSNAAFQSIAAPDGQSNPSGNSVSLEAEMVKVAETQAQFQAATNLYAKALQMMRTAIGRGS